MTEETKTVEDLQKENAALQEELNMYKELYSKEKESKLAVEKKLEQAKLVARKGVETSKDVFQVTRSIFGKAKDSFKEEWAKQRKHEENKQDIESDELESEKNNK